MPRKCEQKLLVTLAVTKIAIETEKWPPNGPNLKNAGSATLTGKMFANSAKVLKGKFLHPSVRPEKFALQPRIRMRLSKQRAKREI